MKHSEYADGFKNELKDLANWVYEIHAGIYPHLVSILRHNLFLVLDFFLFFFQGQVKHFHQLR